MIIVFYGARDSGKTTLSKMFHNWLKNETNHRKIHYIDSDKIKYIFSQDGQAMDVGSFELHQKAVTIGRYEESLNEIVLMALPFPTSKERKLLDDHPDVLWIYLKFDDSIRGNKTKKQIVPFEIPDLPGIDTGKLDEIKSFERIVSIFKNHRLRALTKKTN